MCSVENLDKKKQLEPVKVAGNDFDSDFFDLNSEFSRFKIAVELSFHDGEFSFHELTSA